MTLDSFSSLRALRFSSAAGTVEYNNNAPNNDQSSSDIRLSVIEEDSEREDSERASAGSEQSEVGHTFIFSHSVTEAQDTFNQKDVKRSVGYLIWQCWVLVLTFWLPIKYLKRGQPDQVQQAFREKMAWVLGLALFYLVLVYGFLIFPTTVCKSASVEQIFLQGPVFAIQTILKYNLICQITSFVNFSTAIFLILVVVLAIASGVHSVMKNSFVYQRDPSMIDTPLVMHIPCYSEDTQDLLKTINSCARSEYSDHHKLLFVVSDGT